MTRTTKKNMSIAQSHEHHDVRRKNVVTKVPKRKKICHLTVMDVSIFILKIITWN